MTTRDRTRTFARVKGFFVALAAIAISCQSACQVTPARETEIKNEIKKYLGTLAVPGPEATKIWGMSEFRVIGLGLGYGVDRARINKVADSPESYEADVRFWCVGTGLNGEPLKLRRTLHLKVLTEDGKTWRVEDPEFRNDRPLTLLRQILWWMLGALVGTPAVVSVGLGAWAVRRENPGCGFGWLLDWVAFGGVIVAPLLLPAALAIALLDSTVFAIVCFLVSIVITVGVYKSLPD